MKKISSLANKIILLSFLLLGFTLFFGQQKISTLHNLQINNKQIGTAQQSLKKGQEKRVDLNFSTFGKPFSINSKNRKIDALRKNSARILQADIANQTSPIVNSSESPFAAMKGKQEVLAKRDAFSKSFKNADGSFTAIIGSAPIHYKNKQGQFSDIEHSIQKNADATYSYVNKTNLFESYFGATSNEGIKNATAEGELKEFLNTKMYWEVNGKEVGTLQSANSKININKDKAFYPNLYGKISAEFTVETGRRKLNYIIPNKSSLGNIPANAKYLVFSEDIILPKGWIHKITKDGILILDQNKKEIYLYENPNSSDAVNELSREKNTSFETLLNGNVLTIKTKVKTAWLLDGVRKYPVMVDPTVNYFVSNVVASGGRATTGTVVDSGGFITSLNDDLASGAATVGGTASLLRGYAKYDISTIPAGSTITAAISYLNVTSNTTYNSSNYGHSWASCDIDPSNTSNTSSDIYNNIDRQYWKQQPYATTGRLSQTLNPSARTDIQNALGLGWFAMILYPTGSPFLSGEYIRATGRNGSTAVNGAHRPYLKITYTAPVACSGTPTAGTVSVNPISAEVGSTYAVSATGSTSGTGLTFQWQSNTNNAGWVNVGTATSTYAGLTGRLAPAGIGSTVQWRLVTTCTNSGLNNTSNIATFTTAYCTSVPVNDGFDDGITNVTFNTINNTSSSAAGNEYSDFTSISTTVSKGTTYPISVRVNTAGNFTQYQRVWIDWNQDGDFNDAGESYDLGTATNVTNGVSSLCPLNIIIPTTAATGTTRMRVSSRYDGYATPCFNAIFDGEVEDYSLNIISAVSCDPVVATASKNILCPGENVTLSATTTGTGYSYTWYTDFDNNTNTGTIVNGPSTNPSFDIIPTQSTIYTVVARKTGCTEKSLIVVVVTSAPTAITVDPISAVACSGEIIKMSVTSGGIIPPTILDSDFNSTSSVVWTTSSETDPINSNEEISNWGYWNPATDSNFYGNADGTKFVVVDPFYMGPGYKILNSNLISPPLSFGDYSAITMTYQHNFSKDIDGTGVVQISEDGGETWVDLKTYNSSTSGFVNESLSLTPYAGKPYLILRFKFSGSYSLTNFWAVDNIKITGVALPSTVTWSPTTGLFTDLGGSTAYMGGNATTVFASPTATTTYTVSAKTAVGCPSTQTIVVTKGNKDWAGTTDVNWNTAANWEANVVPTADYCVNIPSMTKKPIIQVGTNALAKNLTVQSGGSLLIKGNLSVTDFVKNNGSAGDLILANDANLLQINPSKTINSGPIIAEKTMNLTEARKEYNYLTSPVIGQVMKTIFGGVEGNVPFVLKYNESTDFFPNAGQGTYFPGKGYAVKEPIVTFTDGKAQFKGVPQNGDVTYNLEYKDALHGTNLVGNPYPSNIDIKQLYTSAAGQITKDFSFWDNKANAISVQQGSTYQGAAYAIFNAAAGTYGSGNPAPGNSVVDPNNPQSPAGTKTPNHIVKVGQGFMVKATSAAPLVFKNTQRITDQTAAQFYGKNQEFNEDDRYWLELITPSNLVVSTAVVYFEGGNNEFAIDDSEEGGTSDALFTFAGDNKVIINGRDLFNSSEVLPLGTRHFTSGVHKIQLGNREGVFANGQNIYLKDKQTSIITNLSEGTYTFSAFAGETTGRFEILYQPEIVLATDGAVKEDLSIYRDGSDFVVKAQSKKITALEVFDGVGRLIYSLKPNTLKVTIPADQLVNGVYVLKIDQAGKITTKKVVR